jgi:aryl carrier-like protein
MIWLNDNMHESKPSANLMAALHIEPGSALIQRGLDSGRISTYIGDIKRKLETLATRDVQEQVGMFPISQAALALDLSEERVRHLCYKSKIANITKGKIRYFRPEWVADYILSGKYQKKLT